MQSLRSIRRAARHPHGRTRVRSGVRVAVVFAALLTPAGALASMASASTTIQGVQVLARDGAFDSVNQKGVFIGCPAGKSLLSAGGHIRPNNIAGVVSPLASFQSLSQVESPKGVSVIARELPFGTTDSWRVTAAAVCATPPPGLERVQASSSFNSNNSKSVTAQCPSGKSLLGPTARVAGGSGHVIIDDLTPSPDRRSVTLAAFEDHTGTSESWSLTVGAICATGDPAGIERIVTPSADDSSEIKVVDATCSPGKRVIGVGADITGGVGNVVLSSVLPVDFPAQGVQVTARETGPSTSANWFLRGYALCAVTA
jgi:hypothetical protein